ncbi:MAG: hypothetical protein RL341_1326 [Pseudomonadota bacterium]|jgi:uncharacterized protein (DUF58 family)
MFEQARARVNAWVLRRLKPEHGQITLQRRGIYILPTKAGLLMGMAMAAMLVASINYQLSLGYLFTFLIGAVAVVGMHRTHDTLLGLQITCLDTRPAHAGGNAVFVLRLTNPHRYARAGLQVRVDDAALAARGAAQAPRDLWVGPNDSIDVHLEVSAPRRGFVACPRLLISTVYPLGIFRSWSYVWPAAKAMVYPAIVAHPAPPTGQGHGIGANRAGSQQDAFSHVAPYQDGQDSRFMYWRALARGVVAVREHEGEAGDEHIYRLDSMPENMPLEEKLARIATAVVRADVQGARFGVSLGQEAALVNRGAAHRHDCLAKLAVFRLSPA